MTSLILDTNAYSEFMKGDSVLKEIFKRTDHLYFPFIVIAELFFGFKLGSKEKENLEQLDDFIYSNSAIVLYPSESTLAAYAGIAVELRKKGTPIPTNDIWIVAFAKEYNYSILSFDSHFANVEGVSLISTPNSLQNLLKN